MTEAVSLADFLSDNMEAFDQLSESTKAGLEKVALELPPEFHAEVRSGLLQTLVSVAVGSRQPLKVRIVVDANAVAADAFRVGSGKTSSWPRLVASPYVEMIAAPNIRQEVEHTLQEDMPRKSDPTRARAHAELLLSQLKIVAEVSLEALRVAHALLVGKAPEDIPVLGVFIDSGADALLSYDKKAFENLENVKRWELKHGAEVILRHERESLALAIVGTSMELLGPAVEKLLIALTEAFDEVVKWVAVGLAAFIEGTVDALSRVPGWVWVGVGLVLLGVGIYALVSKDFRDWVVDGFSAIAEKLKPAFDAVAAALRAVWAGLREVLVWLWNTFMPLTVAALVLAGVVFREGLLLVREVERLGSTGFSHAV